MKQITSVKTLRHSVNLPSSRAGIWCSTMGFSILDSVPEDMHPRRWVIAHALASLPCMSEIRMEPLASAFRLAKPQLGVPNCEYLPISVSVSVSYAVFK